MGCKSSDDYISNRAWLRDIVGGKEVILCGVSALEYLQLFDGYVKEKEIEVYSLEHGTDVNITYHIVSDFENIEYFQHGNVLCSSVSQTFNDMLKDYDNVDELALIVALSNYYYEHNSSFEGIQIKSENIKTFEQIKECAIGYYNTY